MSLTPDVVIEEDDCLLVEPFELDDISILDKNLHHEYPEYEFDEDDLPQFDIGDNL